MGQNKVCWAQFAWTPSKNIRAACEKLTDPKTAHAVAALEYARRPKFAKVLQALPAMDIRDVCARVHITTERNKLESDGEKTVVHVGLQSTKIQLLPAWIQNTVIGMAGAHALITNESAVRVRVAIVRGTPCPRWHVDKVPLRGLCTLYGPATVIWDENERVPIYLGTGDALFLRGATPDVSHEQRALTHRSPLVEQTLSNPRLIVQTDCWSI